VSATWKIEVSSSSFLFVAMKILGVFHAREMLDRSRNADRDIDVRRDDLAGLASLIIVRTVACVYRCAAGPSLNDFEESFESGATALVDGFSMRETHR